MTRICIIITITCYSPYTYLHPLSTTFSWRIGSTYKTEGVMGRRAKYLTPIRGDSEFEHCSTALPYHRSPIPFGSVLYTSKKTPVRFSRLRAEPTRSSAVSCIHAHRLHRVDGHCTLNKAAGVNCTGFNERRSAHPSIRPLEWRPLSTVFNRRRFLNYWEHFSWNRPPTRWSRGIC